MMRVVLYSLGGRRKKGRGSGEGEREKGREQRTLSLSPIPPFPFLTIPDPFSTPFRRLGPIISDHTKQHCRNKQSMITPEA